MSSRLLLCVLACASAFSISSLPGLANAGSSGTADLSSEVATGDNSVDTSVDSSATAEDKRQQEIDNCFLNSDGQEFEADSQEQLVCQARLLGQMESSDKATDYYNQYFKDFLKGMLDSKDSADHVRAKELIAKLQARIKGKNFSYVETSLKALATQAKYSEQKDKLLEERLAVDVLNDPQAEAKLAEINRKEVLLDGQYNGTLTQQGLDVTKDPGAVGNTTSGADAILANLDAKTKAAQQLWEAYNGGSPFQRGEAPKAGADGVVSKATPATSLISEKGIGLPDAPAMPTEGQGFGANVPSLDGSVN